MGCAKHPRRLTSCDVYIAGSGHGRGTDQSAANLSAACKLLLAGRPGVPDGGDMRGVASGMATDRHSVVGVRSIDRACVAPCTKYVNIR